VGEGRNIPPEMERYTVAGAAARLGITTGAVRNRLSRGTLKSEKEGGTVYVLLPTDTLRDAGRDTTDTPGDIPPTHERDPLTSELRDRLRYVEGQLEAERQAHAEARRIIAGLVERIPAIEAPASPEATESPSEATPQPGRVEPQPAVEGTRGEDSSPLEAQETPEMHMPEVHGRPRTPSERPWWRRMFGG
jgi:hypothetical protein